MGSTLVSIPKSDLLAVPPGIGNLTDFGVLPYADHGDVLQPVVCFDGSEAGQLLATGDAAAGSSMLLSTVEDAASTNATLSPAETFPVAAFASPPDAVQPDGTANLAANDARLSGTVRAAGGVLYAVRDIEVNHRDAIRWYRINATNQTLLESGTITDSNLDLIYPAIAGNADGVVVIAYNGCSSNTFISCYVRAGETVEGVTAFGDPVLLQSGTASYHGDDETLEGNPESRWGDYSTVLPDPADPTRFWTFLMYPSDVNIWSMKITELLTTQVPQVSISRSGVGVEVSWPEAASGYRLETTTDLTANAWVPVTETVTTNGGRFSVLVPESEAQEFFRLEQGP